MQRRTCTLLMAVALVTVSCMPIISAEQRSQSSMYSGSGSYSVDSTSNLVNGKHVQSVTINGHGISEHMQFSTSYPMSLSVYNTDRNLIIADPQNANFLIFSEKPGILVIMKDGVCTEKTYHTSSEGTSSTSKQLGDSQCQAIRRKAAEVLEKNRVYWEKWSKNFNKNMQDNFPPGFPFQNQQRNSGSSMFAGNMFQGLAGLGTNMHKSFMAGFPFNKRK